MDQTLLEALLSGQVVRPDKVALVSQIPWQDHPTFPGVALKHLITGQHTDGQFSSHIVRVASGCALGEHSHAGKWELHEVIAGRGKCSIEGKVVDYATGVCAVIPADKPHSVQACEHTLYVLAKFVPALL